MMMNDKWVNVDPRTKKLSIRFRVRGYTKQFYLSTGLRDTKKNRILVESRRDAIEHDIALGQFDSTLDKYRFGSKHLAPKDDTTQTKTIPELWEMFTLYQSNIIEETTIRTIYTRIAKYIDRFPTQDLNKAPLIRDWLLKNTTQLMGHCILSRLNQCCEWAYESDLISHNPFKKIIIPKPRTKSNEDNTYKAFTLEQRDIIINAFENSDRHSHYAPLIKFLFYTGVRLGEAFALTWGDIDPACRRISITKSRNIHRILKGTKNGKRRVFPVSEGSKLHLLLLEMRPQEVHPGQLLFRSKTGRSMTSEILEYVWNNSSAKKCDRSFGRLGIVTQLVEDGKIPYYLKPYATRHTFATWAISSGVTVDKVALWIGDDVATVISYYCHPNVVDSECPDF
jgi:integrase